VQANFVNIMSRIVSLLGVGCSIAVAGATCEQEDGMSLVQMTVKKHLQQADEDGDETVTSGVVTSASHWGASSTCTVTDDTFFSVFDGKVSLLQADIDTDAGFRLKDIIDHDGEGKDMWLVRGRAHDDSTVRIAARYWRDVSAKGHQVFLKSLAVSGGFITNRTLIIRPMQDAITWNDKKESKTILAEENSTFNVEGLLNATRKTSSRLVGGVWQTNPSVEVQLPKGVKMLVTRQQKYVNVAISMPPLAIQDGLCGNFNGDASDDTLKLIRSRGPSVKDQNSMFPKEWVPPKKSQVDQWLESRAILEEGRDNDTLLAAETAAADEKAAEDPATVSGTAQDAASRDAAAAAGYEVAAETAAAVEKAAEEPATEFVTVQEASAPDYEVHEQDAMIPEDEERFPDGQFPEEEEEEEAVLQQGRTGATLEVSSCTIADDPVITVFDGKTVSLLQATEIHAFITSSEHTADMKLFDMLSLEDGETQDVWVVQGKSDDGKSVNIQARYMRNDSMPDRQLFVKSLAIGGDFIDNNLLVFRPLQDSITWTTPKGKCSDILVDQKSRFKVQGLLKAKRGPHSGLVEDPSIDNPGVEVKTRKGVKLLINRQQHSINIVVSMPPLQSQDGLCGNFNGDSSDDTLELIEERNPRVADGQSMFPTA